MSLSNHSGSKKPNQTSSPSKLLTTEENEILFKIMGPRCQAQVSAVVQVFGTEPPSHSSWKKLHCGVATFTKDNSRRSYFIQIFDIVKEQKLLEQELYNSFTYHISLPFFHQFEGENQMVGLNFADNQEAESFSKVIIDRLEAKQRKRDERRRQQQQEMNSQQTQLQLQNQQRHQNISQQNSIQSSLTFNSNLANKHRARKGKRTNKIRKDQIGEPTNFQHVSHVGFDQDKGFSSFNANEELNEFFKMAGVSQHLLQDDSTRRFIYDFIDQHGGVERAAQETKVYGSIKRAPSTIDKSQALHQSNESTGQKPALPSRNSNPSGAPPPPPPPRPNVNSHSHAATTPPSSKERIFHEKEAAPPPPPQITSHHSNPPPPPPPRISLSSSSTAATSSHSPRSSMANGGVGGGGAPPPPPPPPMGNHPPPPPPPSINTLPNPSPRSDLLAQIRQRPTLNPVSQQKIEKPEKDSRTTLLSEIRNREYELKPVTISEGDTSPVAPPVENSMAAMLARALEGRAKVIQDESDSEDDEDEDEDEWDDN